jgi:hypothetical protein
MARTVSIPESIKVGGLRFKVETVKDLKSGDKPCFGIMAWDDQKICLDTSIPSKEMVVNILLHEILHALWAYYNLPGKDEEKSVFLLANGLSALWKDNPELMDYIVKAYK